MNRTCEHCRAFQPKNDIFIDSCHLHPSAIEVDLFHWCLDWLPKEKPKAEGEKVKRKTVYPADFTPDERACNLAKGQGQNVHALAAQFKDHHVAKGSLFTDWQAAFRTWLRNDVAYRQKGKP